jgi:hypothetical protein
MPATIDGTPAPLLTIWADNQTTRVHPADPLRVHVVTPPTPPIPPRPRVTTVGAGGTDTVEVPSEDEPAPAPARAARPARS